MRGRVLADRFELEREVGAGGMACVWRAHDLATSQPCAVKLLSGFAESAALRFDLEAGLLAELRHPGIVRHLAHGRDVDGTPFLAMEWLEGEDLAHRLAAGPLAVHEVLDVVQAAAEALAAAHAQGVVHRDVKPSNLFLPARGAIRIKLLDFGIARRSAPGSVRLTAAGVAMGTPAYMAPEQARASDMVDLRADIFALGCVLFECITGRPAFAGADEFAVLAKILLEDAPRLRDVCPAPPALDQLCSAMMAKDPRDRPGDATRVAVALAGMDRDPTVMMPTGPTSRGAGLSGQERRVVCVVLAAPRKPAGSTTDALGGTTMASAASGHTQLRATLDRIGARLEVLGDGSLVVTVGRAGSGSDLAAKAAQSALAVRRVVPEAVVVLAAGRSDLSARVPVGEAIDRAARLLRAHREGEGLAPRGVAVDEAVAGMLDARFVVVRESSTKPPCAWLLAENPIAKTTRTLLGKTTPFVGRDLEIAALEAAFDEAAASRRARVTVVWAPAGGGKSRLAHELTTALGRRPLPPRLLTARVDAMSGGAPYALLASTLRAEAGIADDAAPEERRARLSSWVGRTLDGSASDARTIAMFLGEAIGVPFPEDEDLQLRAARRDPVLMGDRVRAAVVSLIAAQCARGPLVLLLEDIHWADAPSLQLVDWILAALAEAPLFVLALARPEVREKHPALWSEHHPALVELGALPDKACQHLVRQALGELLSWRGAAEMVARAQGNPFFLEELIRAQAEGRGDRLPESILATIEARLDSLEPEGRRALRAASVFGRVFWEDGVVALLPDMAPERARAVVDQLVSRELASVRPRSRFGERRELSFGHDLLQEATYATLTEEDRAVGHRLAGGWLEQAGESNALTLAEHWERGGELSAARRAYLAAARQALAANDFSVVLSLVDRASQCGAMGEELGQLRVVGAEAAGWRGDLETQERWATEAMDLLPRDSPAWFRAAVEAAGGSFRRANEQRHASVVGRIVASRVGSGGLEEIRACTRLARGALLASFNRAAMALLDRIDELARRMGTADPEVEAAMLVCTGLRSMAGWDPAGTIEPNRRLVEVLERAGDLRTAAFVRGDVGFALMLLGAYEEAETTLRALLAATQKMRLGPLASVTRVVLGLTVTRLGRATEGRGLIEAAHEYFDRTDNARNLVMTSSALAMVLLAEGELEAAERYARAALDDPNSTQSVQSRSAGTLAHILVACGRHEEAVAVSAHAIELRGGRTGPDDDPIVLLARAEALLASGDVAAARDAARAARDDIAARAAKIGDARYRETFLSRAYESVKILELARQLLPEES